MNSENDPSNLLYEAITAPKKKLAFFVGAGISINSGLEDFKGFSKQFLGSIGPANWTKEDNQEINIVTESLRPEVLLQVIQQVHGNNCLKFYSALDSGIPNPNHYFLALALLRGHCIFTTNVDTFIEKACKNIGIPCTPIIHEKSYRHFLQKQPVDFSSQLFKLHGSIESNSSGLAKYKSIRFTLDRVGFGLGNNARQTLASCLQERDFIFLGYSGNDHFSVYPVLVMTNSNQNIYWFKFSSSSTLSACDSTNFLSQRNNKLKEALKGSSIENWAFVWEYISVRDILIARAPRSYLFEGNSSYAIEDIVDKIVNSEESPEYLKLKGKLEHFQEDKEKLSLLSGQRSSTLSWVDKITDFKRHLCASMLFIRARNLTLAEPELKCAEKCAKNDIERAEMEKVRAATYSITRRIGKEKPSEDDLQNAIKTFKIQGDLVAMIETHLELANILRIDRDFGSALETLDKIEDELKEIKSKLREQKKAYDWPRLMSHLFFLRGLIYGLGLRGTLKDKFLGIQYCDEAFSFARQAGDIIRQAAAKNAKGLIISQFAERSSIVFQEAEYSLNEALLIIAQIRDPRSFFQPSRNLLLIHRLRLLRSKSKIRDHWLNEAWEEVNRAQDCLNQIKIDNFGPIRDQIELDFRKAQLLGLKGEKENAQSKFKDVLDYWEQRNDLHQQARVWQELLSLAKNQDEIQNCLSNLLNTIELLFQSKEEQDKYKNDLLRLENIMDMFIDAYEKAYESNDQEHLNRIINLGSQGEKIAEKIGDNNLTCYFKIYSSIPLEEVPYP